MNHPENRVINEVKKYLNEWSVLGIADITLREMQEISYLINPMNRGVLWNCLKKELSHEAWKEIFFHIVRTAITNEYVVGHANITTEISSKRVNTKYYAYLKPSLKYRARTPVLQLYGNIYISLDIVNDTPIQLKVHSNVYQGRGYVEAQEFEEFIIKLQQYEDHKR